MSTLFGSAPAPSGSAQCPACGRYSRIVRVVNDSAPLSAEESGYVIVECAQHGRGIS